MFDTLDTQLAREQLAAIARDRAKYLKPEGRDKALEWVTLVLEQWKLEQAAPDGTIELQGQLGGLLSMAGAPKTRRAPVSELRPEQCAGPNVRCAYDLLMQLDREGYPAVAAMTAKIPLDVLGALLIARDYKTMPIDGMALAARLFWMMADELAREFRRALSEKESKKAEDSARRVVEMHEKKQANTRLRANIIERLGVEFFQRRENRGATNADAAKHIYDIVKDDKVFSNMTVDGIKDKLSGTKKRALAMLPEKVK